MVQIVAMKNELVTAEASSGRDFILEYLRAIEADPYLKGAPHFMAVESNLGKEADWTAVVVAGSDLANPPRLLNETWRPSCKSYAPGVLTTNDVKYQSVQLLEMLMNADCIGFSERLASTGDQGGDIQELGEQMRRFRKIPLNSRSVDALDRYAYSAKAGPDDKKSDKLQDDLVMALLLACYWLKCTLAGELKGTV